MGCAKVCTVRNSVGNVRNVEASDGVSARERRFRPFVGVEEATSEKRRRNVKI